MTPNQRQKEGLAFSVPGCCKIPHDENLANLIDIGNVIPYTPGFFIGDAMCPLDLHILSCYIRHIGAKTVTEFGVGISTILMRLMGISVRAFSLELSEQGALSGGLDKIPFTVCNIMNKKFQNRILSACKASDLIVIDCQHSWNMAEYYWNNFLCKVRKPVFIHDMKSPYSDRKGTGEQKFLFEKAIGKTHDILLYTDVGPERIVSLSEELDIGLGKGMKRNCAMILTSR